VSPSERFCLLEVIVFLYHPSATQISAGVCISNSLCLGDAVQGIFSTIKLVLQIKPDKYTSMSDTASRSSEEDASASFGRAQSHPDVASLSGASDLDSRPGLRKKQADTFSDREESIDSLSNGHKMVADERAWDASKPGAQNEAKQRKGRIVKCHRRFAVSSDQNFRSYDARQIWRYLQGAAMQGCCLQHRGDAAKEVDDSISPAILPNIELTVHHL